MILHPNCYPTCDGRRYQIMEGAHVIDCWIRDSFDGPIELAIAFHKLWLEHHGYEVIKYWPESDHRFTDEWLSVTTGESIATMTDTHAKHPPYLFLVKEKA